MSIEKYLVLNRYLFAQLGSEDLVDFNSKANLNQCKEGLDEEGRSQFLSRIKSIPGCNISSDKLFEYDSNINEYLQLINEKREQEIILKYFQYLSILFTEYLLDNIKNNKDEFIFLINDFVKKYCIENRIDIDKYPLNFGDNDLNKIAFWSATGSGKTIIMHINYHQFFKYGLFEPNNILLITPNEGLTDQHYDELRASSIPCIKYSDGYGITSSRIKIKQVLIIEITKFVDEKKGGGLTLPAETFEGPNLVFVDEGHKGQVSNGGVWKNQRDKLVGIEKAEAIKDESEHITMVRQFIPDRIGFTFEYSATFGQVLTTTADSRDTLIEYAQGIIFDYSYRYFHDDKFGKEFNIINVKPLSTTKKKKGESDLEKNNREAEEETADNIYLETNFIANLLTYYQQLRVYFDNIALAKEFNVEKPLWVLVGTSVSGKELNSDVLRIVKLIAKVFSDETWFENKASEVIQAKTVFDSESQSVFGDKFDYLLSNKYTISDIFQLVFGGKGEFRLQLMKNADGEIGLKAGEDFFGVINIGETPKFKKLCEKSGIRFTDDDAVKDSLFKIIKDTNSPINVLIGSKKFIEGWDTWRVSSMGLLNIGSGKGPMIIQLFGRGVRLKGKDHSLKRSLENPLMRVLQTLEIFGMRSNYLENFLSKIRKEIDDFETINIPVRYYNQDLWKDKLCYLIKDESKIFTKEKIIDLSIDQLIVPAFTLDLLPKISIHHGNEAIQVAHEVEAISLGRAEFEPLISCLDWSVIYNLMLKHKKDRAYWNLTFNINTLRSIVTSADYKIRIDPSILQPERWEDITRLQALVVLLLKKFMDAFYKHFQKGFESKTIKYTTIGETADTILNSFNADEGIYTYTVKINSPKDNLELISNIRSLAANIETVISEDQSAVSREIERKKTLPRIFIDNHLYLPLLLKRKFIEQISPPGLEPSEEEFIKVLKKYVQDYHEVLSGKEIFLLRNHPKKGIGFFNLSYFYPDFILWIQEKKKQKMIFLDPKGLQFNKAESDEKLQLHKEIKVLEHELGNKNLQLEAFILSKTKYSELVKGQTAPKLKEQYIAEHVLFMEDHLWIDPIFKI